MTHHNAGLVVGPERLWKPGVATRETDERYRHFWLTDDRGNLHSGMWDFRNTSARKFYVDDLLRQTNATSADGCFVDTGDAIAVKQANLSVASRRAIFNATALLWKELVIAGSTTAKTFLATPSLKSHLGRQDNFFDGSPLCNASSGMKPCSPYGEEAIYDIMGDTPWAPHRQYNIPSRDFGKDSHGCASLVVTTIGQGRRGPQLATCNGCNVSTTQGHASFNVSFAAFLMGVEVGSYFGAGEHFHNDTSWDFAWPQLQRPTGKPRGPAVRTGLVFERRFEHIDARIDCTTQTGTLLWH